MRGLQVIDRHGPEEYSSTLSVQTNLLEAKIADRELDDLLVLVEHEEVFTVGRSVAPQVPEADLKKSVRWIEVGRGGDATFHGPGQLVAYPIFDLERHGKDVHVFLRKLESAGIRCLARFGIRGETRKGQTGIWVQQSGAEQGILWRKIASIGIGVRKWISYHGLAINVSTDLSYFKAISPCGEEGEVMTSLEELLESTPSMGEVKAAFTESMIVEFDLKIAGKAEQNQEKTRKIQRRSRPSWLKVKAPGSPEYQKTLDIVREHKLVTVCEEARCPNMGECWSHNTATFMIMGELCTRRCSFCSVKDGTLNSLDPLDPLEPLRVAQAVERLGLKHVVITSVNRDDLPDMGAKHFDQTVRAIKHLNSACDVELLIPDMRGRRALVEMILASGQVRVLNHNVETIPRLYKMVRPGAVFKRSLEVLRWAKEISPNSRTKSGLMVGLGEKKEEILEVMDALRESNVEVLTIGQYLQPTEKQLDVRRFVTPEEFKEYEGEGKKRGFLHVESGPLVRSSYHAWQHTGEDTASLPSPTLQAELTQSV